MSAMEVEELSQGAAPGAIAAKEGAAEAAPPISVHPLAIVSMSDQFTRITTGGSALSKQEPVVGLLFGCNRSVTDAEDVPIIHCPSKGMQQVQLHQAVFPQHAVVGWYRVVAADSESAGTTSDAAGPTPEDLLLSAQLQKQYYNTNSTEMPFLFALLQVNNNSSSSSNSNSEQEDDDDDELPLQLFAVDAAQHVLVGLDDWKLETATAERLAVERVMKEDNHQNAKDNNSNSNHHIFVQATQPVQRSVEALQERWAVIEDYLQATAVGTVPANPALLRQIQGLLLSVGPLAAVAVAPESNSALTANAATPTAVGNNATPTTDDLLQQLTLLAQTVTTIQQYSDKVKVVHDVSSGYGGGAPAGAASSPASNSDLIQRRGGAGGNRAALARGLLFKSK